MSISVAPASSFSMLPSIGGTSTSGGAQAAFSGLFSLLQGQSQTDAKANIILFTPDQNALSNFVSEHGSDADLQDLLSSLKDQGLLSNAILVALTPGTPAVSTDGFNDAGIATLSLDELSTLVSSNADALKNANVLLVATPVQPSNMDELVQSISNALTALKNQNGTVNLNGNAGATSQTAADDDDAAAFQVLLVRLQPVQPTEVSASSSTNAENAKAPLPLPPSDSENDLSEEDMLLDPALLSALLCGHPQDKFAPIGIVEHASDRARSVSAFAPSSGDGLSAPLAPFEVAQNGVAGKGNIQGAPSAGMSGALNVTGSMDLDGSSDGSASARFMLAGDPSQTFLDTSSSTSGLSGLNALLQQQNTTSPVLNNSSAASAHTATQTVSATLTNMVQNGEIKSQQVSLELDPPELGKIQVHLSIEKGESMKVRIVAETDDALLILKRDIHNLKQSLEAAGLKMDDSSLSFDLSQGGSSFGQAMGQNQNGAQQSRHDTSFSVSGIGGTSFAADGLDESGVGVEQTQMNIQVNPETGTVHYNILA